MHHKRQCCCMKFLLNQHSFSFPCVTSTSQKSCVIVCSRPLLTDHSSECACADYLLHFARVLSIRIFYLLYPAACETSLLEQQIPTTPIMSPGHPGNPVPPDQRSGNVTKRCEAAWLAAAAFSSSGLHHVGQTPSQLNLDKHAAIRKFSRVQASVQL